MFLGASSFGTHEPTFLTLKARGEIHGSAKMENARVSLRGHFLCSRSSSRIFQCPSKKSLALITIRL
jgi:hypothetical protein